MCAVRELCITYFFVFSMSGWLLFGPKCRNTGAEISDLWAPPALGTPSRCSSLRIRNGELGSGCCLCWEGPIPWLAPTASPTLCLKRGEGHSNHCKILAEVYRKEGGCWSRWNTWLSESSTFWQAASLCTHTWDTQRETDWQVCCCSTSSPFHFHFLHLTVFYKGLTQRFHLD